ncbi:unnamed protein product, partial [Rotaria sp. Silwood2]
NDYDQRRLCIGPYSGRSLNISKEFKLININEKEYQFDDDDDDDNNNQDFLHTSSTYEVDKLNDFGVVVHQYLMKQYDNQKHSSVFMSGDEESWSKRGG